MGDLRRIVLALLLVQVVELRPTMLKRWTSAKYRAANGGVDQVHSAGAELQDKHGRPGLVLYGSLEDLDKFQVELFDKQNNNGEHTNIRFNLAELVKEQYKNLKLSKNTENTKDLLGPDEEDSDNEEERKINMDFMKYLKSYEENDKSEEYNSYDEIEGKQSLGEIINEDEYNDYSEDEVHPENVEDESESEEIYDEDEKYYDEMEEDSEFDGGFMNYD